MEQSLVEGLRFCVMTDVLIEHLSLRSRVGPTGCTTAASQRGTGRDLG